DFQKGPDGLRNHKTLALLGLRPRPLSPHRMVPGGREPLARPPQDPLLAFLAGHAERHEECLLQATSQNAHRPLANPGQPPPSPSTPPLRCLWAAPRLWPISISAPTRWVACSANCRCIASPFPAAGQVPPQPSNASSTPSSPSEMRINPTEWSSSSSTFYLSPRTVFPSNKALAES